MRKKISSISVLVLVGIITVISSLSVTVQAKNVMSVDDVEMNKTIPKVSGTQALAYVDFDSTNGVSSDWKGQYYDLAKNGNDKLTLKEVQGIEDKYTVIFRAKINQRGDSSSNTGKRDRAVFTIFPNGTTAPDTSSSWCESLAIGMLGGNDGNDEHSMYYEIRKNIAVDGKNTLTELSKGSKNVYPVTRAADVQGDNNWHTIALVQIGNGFRYYVDGKLLDFVNTESLNSAYGYDNVGAVFQSYDSESDFHAWIGRFYATNGGVVDAKFDWFAFYGDALTTEQIQKLSKTYQSMAKYYNDISEYRSEGGYSYETIDGYVFAGWYKDEACTVAYDEAGANKATGAYAKYVPEEVLDVKCQISEEYDYTNYDGKTVQGRSMKFITSVDSLNYKKVGFQLTKDADSEMETKTVSSNGVCTKIFAKKSNSETVKYKPQKTFCDASVYFKTYTIEQIPDTDYGVEVIAKPFWITKDGTTVYGRCVTRTIQEGILSNVISGADSLKVTGTEKKFAVDSPWEDDSTADTAKMSYSAQGGYTDGTYVYQAFIEKNSEDTTNQGTDNRVRICVYDMKGNRLVNKLVTSKETGISLDHANDITYNSRVDCYLISHASPGYTKVSYFKLNKESWTLDYVETKTLDYNIISIDYQKDTDRYVVGLKGTQAFRILDSDFHAITPEFQPTTRTSGCTTQGVACDGNYVYFVLYNPNVIAVYKWDGTFQARINLTDVLPITSLSVRKCEPENISVIENKIYLGCTSRERVSLKKFDTFEVYMFDSSKLIAN